MNVVTLFFALSYGVKPLSLSTDGAAKLALFVACIGIHAVLFYCAALASERHGRGKR